MSINDPIKKYIPDVGAAWEKITVFNLLTHTSGIPNFTSFPDYPKLEPFAATPEQLVARFRDKPLDFEPGEKWSYSNSGYVLLSYLIEKITAGSYEKFVVENIFTPLGMKDSGYDSNTTVIAHRASGYVHSARGFENAGFVNMSIPLGAGGLYSTTEDLLRWEQGLFGGKLLRPASLEKMITPFKNDYALGLEVRTTEGHKVVQHNGGIEGFNTVLLYYPEDKLTVVVLGNVNGPAPDQIAPKLAAVAHGENVTLTNEREEILVDAKVLARYTGVYQFAPGMNMLVTMEDNHLSTKLGSQPFVPIYAESETMFFAKLVDAQIEFPKTDGEAKASQLILHQNGRDQTAKRLDDAQSKLIADAAAAAAKRFKDQTAAPGTEAALRRDIEELRLGEPKYDLMSPMLANVTRQQLPQLKSMMNELGSVESVTFKGVGPGGADIYEVKFVHGSTEWRIAMASDVKIESVGVRRQ